MRGDPWRPGCKPAPRLLASPHEGE